jgi:F-type H+-transporting ATPase subunit b
MPSPETWVAIGFVVFVALLVYLRTHRKVADALDQRQARIKAELSEASRLFEEAQALLAEFERKALGAESEAEAIIDSAKAETERLAGEAKLRMEELVARRTKMAETKIAQAEAQALADVRSAAADAAVAVAAKILHRSIVDGLGISIVRRDIDQLRDKLNGPKSRQGVSQ